VVDVLVKDPLGKITQFVDGGRHKVGFHSPLRLALYGLELPGQLAAGPLGDTAGNAQPRFGELRRVPVRVPEGTFHDGRTG
jgi:hypothetical protein